MARQSDLPSTAVPISLTAKLLAAGIVCCTLEGAVRKWVMPNSGAAVQAIMYFSKDVFWILAALTAWSHRPFSVQVIGLRSPFFLGAGFIGVGILSHVFNAAPVGAILSFKAMIGMPFLALIIAPALGRSRDLEFLGKVIGILCIGAALLGAIQFNAPRSHFLNQQVDTSQQAIQDEENTHVRASGPFAFISGMSSLSILGTWAACFFLFSQRKSTPLGSIILLAALTCSAAALTRTGLFTSLIVLVGAIVLGRGGFWLVVLFTLLVLAVGPMIFVDAIMEGETGLATAAFRRHMKTDSIERRILMLIDQAIEATEAAPFGVGLGRSQSCELKDVGGAGELPIEARYEVEHGRIIAEVGIAGLAGVLLIRIAFLWKVWQAFMQAHSRHHFSSPRLLAASLLALGLFFVANLVFDHTACFFSWVIGVMVLAIFEAEAGKRHQPLRNDLRTAISPKPNRLWLRSETSCG